VRRSLVLTLAVLASASTAKAALVYQQSSPSGAAGVIVAANNGSGPRMLAPGSNPLISPNGKLVAFTRGSNDVQLRVIATAGGHSRLIVRHAAAPLAWDPDNRHLVAITSVGASRVVLYSVVGGAVRTIDSGGLGFSGPSFSPDGQTLAFADITGGYELTLARVSDPVPSDIATSGLDPVWGCGGLIYLAFASSEPLIAPISSIAIRAPFGSPPRTLLTNSPDSAESFAPVACSQHATMLVSEVGVDATYHAGLLSPTTGALTVLSPTLSAIDAISSDGRLVLAEQNGNVVEVNTLTSQVTVLAHNAQGASWTTTP
jgi:hypothetical protein